MSAIKPPTTKTPQKEGKTPFGKRDYGILFPVCEFVNGEKGRNSPFNHSITTTNLRFDLTNGHEQGNTKKFTAKSNKLKK
jgi:hypothetical protein